MLTALRRTAAVGLASVALAAATTVPASAATWQWHQDYYNNYFKGYFQCVARGEGVIGNRYRDQRIAYAKAYLCHRPWGDRRWSMDILFRYTKTCPVPRENER